MEKQVTYKITSPNNNFAIGDPNFPRVRVPLCGLFQLGNYFKSCRLSKETTVNGIEYEISGPPNGIDLPVATFSPSQSIPIVSSFAYTVISFGLNFVNIRASVINSERTLYQYMQQYAEEKPILKRVKVQYYNHAIGLGVDQKANVGKLYWAKQTVKNDNNSFQSDQLNMIDLWKPDAISSYGDPAKFLADQKAGTFMQNIPVIEIDIPMDLQLDGNTYFGVDSLCYPFAFNTQLVTLYFQ